MKRAPRTSAAARERRIVVDFLLAVDPTRSGRSYTPPSAPANGLETSVLARYPVATLQALYRSLIGICTARGEELLLDPVFNAAGELLRKSATKPSQLRSSSKLYRAIDDLECATLSDRYRACTEQLDAIVDVLRDLSGWSATQ